MLTQAITDTVEQAGGGGAAVPALRKDRPDAVAFAAALGQLHCHGISPSWNVLYCQARPLTLPTYAFQHQRYWLLPTAGDFSGATHAMHPLDTATELAENRGWVFTGRISPRTQPWLNEHAVESAVLFLNTGFVELALHVADRAGYSSVNELIVHTPCCSLATTPRIYRSPSPTPMTWAGSLLTSTRAHISAMTTPPPAMNNRVGSACQRSPDRTNHRPQPPPLTPVPWPPPGTAAIEVDDFYDDQLHRLQLRPNIPGNGYGVTTPHPMSSTPKLNYPKTPTSTATASTPPYSTPLYTPYSP
ncbi:hypothetical protein OIO89_01105 (plasmid) [Mycobacterium ulcerans]|nr:hypothetical protein OIO89_01105 [Mycobacterium ulcerans]